MKIQRTKFVLAIAILGATTASAQHRMNREEPGAGDHPRLSKGQIAPILEGLGNHHHAITAKDERAQLFFNQGLRLAYGFNHKEADRAFREAARLDPDCAMAYWGMAFVNGPNLNMPMDSEGGKAAYKAIRKALKAAKKVSEPERSYIEALAKRFAKDPKAERAPLDQAYADAMRMVHEKYPDDLDAATLYADALMNLSPWNYWTRDGQPRPNTPKILELFESVIARDMDHAGAHHYYIHAVEASDNPDRAIPSADAMAALMPGAGHMVHMASHIYMRVGQFDKAVKSNEDACVADEGYITQCRAQGLYPMAYYPHNIHFLWWAATNTGQSALSIETARKCAEQMPEDMLKSMPNFQTFHAIPLYALARFGKWDEILAEPAPADDLMFEKGLWHYARGLAFARKHQFNEAAAELAALEASIEHPKLDAVVWQGPPQVTLSIAAKALEGELAGEQSQFGKAVAALDSAVRIQDGVTYNEPPDWYYPVRQSLGAVLLAAGKPAEAATVYWDDLKRNRENPWSLFGLAQALRAQKDEAAAAEIDARFAKVWANADVKLTSSRF